MTTTKKKQNSDRHAFTSSVCENYNAHVVFHVLWVCGFHFSAFATASKKPTFSFKQRGTEAKPGHFKDH